MRWSDLTDEQVRVVRKALCNLMDDNTDDLEEEFSQRLLDENAVVAELLEDLYGLGDNN